jgi:hypothetical protein
MRQANYRPLAPHLGQTTQRKLNKASGPLDLTKHRLNNRLAFGIRRSSLDPLIFAHIFLSLLKHRLKLLLIIRLVGDITGHYNLIITIQRCLGVDALIPALIAHLHDLGLRIGKIVLLM